MKNYWNHRDAETEMLLAAAFFQLVRPGYGEKFRDAVKEVMARVARIQAHSRRSAVVSARHAS